MSEAPVDNSRWRPPFVTALAPDDRCHLNGLGLAPDNQGDLAVRYATALAATDTPQGWRAHKKDGGGVREVPGGALVARGLLIPPSSRPAHPFPQPAVTGAALGQVLELVPPPD